MILAFTPNLTAIVITVFVATLRDDPGLDEGSLRLDINNSHIVIQTHRIERVVAAGPAALAPLVAEIRDDVSLDTFARCYSACDQILKNAGLRQRVRWHGSLIDTDKKGRVLKLGLIDGFSIEFRRAQIAEIVCRAKEVKIVIQNQR